MKRTIAIFTISIFICLLFFTVIVKTASSTVTTTTNDSAAQEIRDKVKEIVREKIEDTQKGKKAGFFGEISKISNNLLTLETNQGNKEVQIATDAAIIQSGKKSEIEDLEMGSFAIAMGYLEGNNSLDTKRLVVAKKTELPEREVAFGQITDISSEENILTIKNENKNLIYTIEINAKTVITKKLDDKDTKIKFSDIIKGDKLITVGTPSENEHKIITAKIIRIISEATTNSEATPNP